jgi:hypothetical protein
MASIVSTTRPCPTFTEGCIFAGVQAGKHRAIASRKIPRIRLGTTSDVAAAFAIGIVIERK